MTVSRFGKNGLASTESARGLAISGLISASTATFGLALELFPTGHTIIIAVAASMLPICKRFIYSPPCEGGVPRPSPSGDVRARSFRLHSSLKKPGMERALSEVWMSADSDSLRAWPIENSGLKPCFMPPQFRYAAAKCHVADRPLNLPQKLLAAVWDRAGSGRWRPHPSVAVCGYHLAKRKDACNGNQS